MKQFFQRGATLVTSVALAAVIAACGASGAASSPTAVPATPAAAAALPTALPTAEPIAQAPLVRASLSASGEVQAVREVDLAVMVSGQIAEVLAAEGARVEQGQVIALLDVRPFDSQVRQAEAALAAARAQEAGLSDAPRGADVRGAQAQVQQAEIALAQARANQAQDIRSAEAALEAARVQEQQARDQLSRAKTQAEAAVQSAAQSLTQAQAAYAKAKSDWDYVAETGNDPQNPELQNADGEFLDNELENAQREAYYAAFVQAEAALRQAELATQQAAVDAEEARKAEVTGVRAAELQVVQSQSTLDRLRLADGESQVALAQVGVELARAQRAQLDPAPARGQLDQAAAGVAQAEAALAQALLNREYAEIRAPFAGVVAAMDLEVGQMVAPGAPVVRLLDDRALRFEAPVADFDIGRIAEGDRVAVRIDGLPDLNLEGSVSYIAPAAEVAGGARTYLVRIELPEMPGVRVGMSGQMLLAAERQE